jgi:hypothetical protein
MDACDRLTGARRTSIRPPRAGLQPVDSVRPFCASPIAIGTNVVRRGVFARVCGGHACVGIRRRSEYWRTTREKQPKNARSATCRCALGHRCANAYACAALLTVDPAETRDKRGQHKLERRLTCNHGLTREQIVHGLFTRRTIRGHTHNSSARSAHHAPHCRRLRTRRWRSSGHPRYSQMPSARRTTTSWPT